MTITELKILIDLHYRNERNVLKEHASWITLCNCYLFVDSEDGHCYLLDENGKIDDVKTLKALYAGYVKKDIKKIVIPNSVESIGSLAFFYYRSLKNIEIPESVEYIGNLTFYNCTSLKEVIFKGKTMDQVKTMNNYPWGINDKSIIKCS